MNLLNREVLLVDKPAGMSSFAVVARIRRVLTEQLRADYAARGLAEKGVTLPKRVKVGHAGTLDPFATGLLICLLGKQGTKRAGEFLKMDKRYEAVIEFGKVSTTGDIEGEIAEFTGEIAETSFLKQPVSEENVIPPSAEYTFSSSQVKTASKKSFRTISPVSSEEIDRVLQQFTGEIVQRVPAYSAVKIQGRRAYELARKGVKVEMPERKVKIYELRMVEYKWPYLKIDCKVSSGTYIRALGEDIGKALGVGGYLTSLRRTEVGEFKVGDAVGLEEITGGELQKL